MSARTASDDLSHAERGGVVSLFHGHPSSCVSSYATGPVYGARSTFFGSAILFLSAWFFQYGG